VASGVDHARWKASLTLREKFYLRFFKLLGLHRPIEVYDRDQVLPMIEAAGFIDYHIEAKTDEIRIKLKK
jgi:hypothetical protein